jgi:hypothetical protein
MNVYCLRAGANNNRGVIVMIGDAFEFARRFNGCPMNHPWTDVTIGWDPDMRRLPKGDFPSLFTNVPVFSRKAATALADLLEGNGELFPVLISDEEYFVFNVTRVIDALDESRSEIIRFDGSSRVMDIDVHCFVAEKLENATIFKIPQVTTMDVFVTDAFVKRVQSARLKGFKFLLLWSSE